MLLPKDPYILLSFLNARLRDQYADLEDLCASLDADEQSLRETLAGVDYRYDPVYHQFIPSSKVYEDDVCYAFNDIDPQAPTHFLVVPKAHIGSVSEITADNSTVVAHIFEVIAKLTKEKGLDSYRVVSNIGEQAGQSVFHLHFHVLSGRDMTWPPG